MDDPESQAKISDAQKALAQYPDRPIAVSEAALGGTVLGLSALFVGQMIEPVPGLGNVPSVTAEVVLLSTSAMLGALALSGTTYATQRFKLWRQLRQFEADLAEHIEEVATPEHVANGIERFEEFLARKAPPEQL